MKYHWKEIRQQLTQLGFSEEQIVNPGKLRCDLETRQYFDLPQLPQVQDEVFVDAGVFHGETSKGFIQWAGGEYKHMYCFEADKRNLPKCHDALADIEKTGKLTLVPKGLWNENGREGFTSDRIGNASAIGNGEECVEVTTLDDALQGERVTFLKMDIEGAEYRALQGAERTIRSWHPKLAISIYHLPEDTYRIPILILSYNPDYRFYLRHYSLYTDETILYAV